MFDEKALYKKYKNKQPMSIIECQWLAYYESQKSRADSDHEPGTDPLVGAVVRDKDGIVIGLSHRACGLEGEHAEFSILKGQLIGRDLSDCLFFTTLEPCVDDVRTKEGTSCTSLLCASAVKTIYIGILDPNPDVWSNGITKLFKSGKTIVPFEKDIQKLIEKDFSSLKTKSDNAKINRTIKNVFSKFNTKSFETFLMDKYLFENSTIDGFNFETEQFIFANYLLDKNYISFSAMNCNVDKDVMIMFYDSAYLKISNRVVMLKSDDGTNKRLDCPLPLLMQEMEKFYNENVKSPSLKYVVFKEAIVNAIIHGNYQDDAPLTYVAKNGFVLKIENDAAPTISQNQLNKLSSFNASPEPGNGVLSELSRLCGYCERDKRGEKTFAENKNQVSCSVDGRHVIVELKLL